MVTHDGSTTLLRSRELRIVLSGNVYGSLYPAGLLQADDNIKEHDNITGKEVSRQSVLTKGAIHVLQDISH